MERKLYRRPTGATNSKVLNAFTYDGNDDSPKEISESKIANIRISPNPNAGKFSVTFEKAIENPIFIRIMDMKGQIIWDKELEVKEQQISLDINPIRNGVYIISISDNKTINVKTKLVITKND